jgi:hypothetical protein
MSGGSCGSGGGCQTKGQGLAWQRLLLDEILPRLYPSGTWGELSAEGARRLGPGSAQRRGAAVRLGQAIDRPALLVAGDPDELCDHVWLPRRRGQSRALLRLLFPHGWSGDHGAASEVAGEPVREAGQAEEHYLCISLSAVAAVAHGRQLTLRATCSDDGLCLEQPPGTNIRDPAAKVLERTLARVLDEVGIAYLDWRVTSAPPPGHAPGRYAELYGGDDPPLAAYLFSPQRPDVATLLTLPLADAG